MDAKLLGISRNKKTLLAFGGFRSIYEAKKHFDEKDVKNVYRHLLSEYNAAVDEIRENRKRREAEQKRQESILKKEAARLLKNRKAREKRADLRETRTVNKLFNPLFDEFNATGKIRLPIDLNQMSITKIVNKILNATAGRDVIMVVGNCTYMLNERTRGRLAEYLKTQFLNTEETMESDGLVIQQMRDVDFITLEIFNATAHVRQRHNGAFFKYTNKTDIDLSRQGVFTEFKALNYEDTCVVYALKMAGVEKERLDKVRLITKNRNIPLKDLEKFCEKLEICIVVKKTDNEQHQDRHIYGKQFAEKEKHYIGLIDNHYFLIEPINITSYAATNCIELKKVFDSLDKYNNVISYDVKKSKYMRLNSRFVDTFVVMKIMFENKTTHLEEILYENSEIAATQFYDRVDGKITNLEYNDTEVLLMVDNKKKPEKKKEEYTNVFFDFETYKNEKGVHIPYLCCATYEDGTNRVFYGENSGKKLLDTLTGNTRLIAHNATYDYRFVIKFMYSLSEIGRGTKMISCKGRYKKFDVVVKDSYKLISLPLGKFGKTFKLETAKEIMPYDLYNSQTITDRYVDIKHALTFLKPDDTNQFIENIDKWNLRDVTGDKYDIVEYSRKYCEIDCIVLKQGYKTFRKWIMDEYAIDIDEVLTLAALTEKILINEGCFDGIYKLSGVPQRFIQNCVVGGRTMVANNTKNYITERVQDFDAVSLYPSAMVRMPGFLYGKPKVITDFNAIKNTADGFFVEIIITKVQNHRSMPLLSYMNENGVRIFSNDIIGRTMFVDSICLEDCVKFQGIEYEFVRGYYFDEGFNSKINTTMRGMFDTRAQKKANKCPSEVVYKLLMNTGYGKTIIKPVDTETRIFDDKERLDVYLSRNYSWVKCYTTMDGSDKIRVESVKTTIDHFNLPHIGVMILSWSKRIMNEVICLAEDNNINVYYQDTDSMHLDEDKIKLLGDKYRETYNRELIGKDLGQFHSDFDFEGHRDIRAVKSIFLGKKSYIDELEGVCEKTGEVHTSYHIRLKGISNDSIAFACKTYNCKTPFELYKRMYRGERIHFDLTCGGKKANFKFNKDYTVHTESVFNRSLVF